MPRTRGRRLAVVAGLGIIVTGLSSPAHAQPASPGLVYVGGAVFADISRFSGDPSTDTLSGQAVGGAVSVGTFLTPRWDIELALEVPARISHLTPNSVVVDKSTTVVLQDRELSRAIMIPVLIRFHSERRGRIQLEYAGGVSVVRLQQDFDTLFPPGTPPALIPKAQTLIGYAAAPILEFDARIAVTPHLDLVPAISVSVFDIATQASAVNLRPRAGLRWTF